MKNKIKKGWEYLGVFYAHNGNISYREIGERFGVSASNVGNAISRLPKKKFSIIDSNGNKL